MKQVKRSSIKSITRVDDSAKFSFAKLHHNRNFYNWVAVPSMFGFPSQWRCYLGNYIVRYRGYSSLAW